MDDEQFRDRVAWITGASSGIGEALAVALAERGAKLVLSARRAAELERVRAATGLAAERCLVLPLDVVDTAAAPSQVRRVLEYFGQIDLLFNNAGISQRSWVKDTPLELDRRIMEVNYFGAVALTKSVLPHMLERRSGHIIVTSSVTGKFGYYLRTAYCASKHALHGFFDSLRLEVQAENIHVLLVCPGKIRTNISVHALTADGTPHGIMEDSQLRGVSSQACAQRILRAIVRREEEIYIGNREVVGVWLKRLSPRLFTFVMRRQKAE